MKRVLVALACLLCASLLGAVGAQAQTDPVAPELAPPTPGPVVDTDSAGVFAKAYVIRNANRFLRQRRSRVRVTDADAACLQSPVLDTRFGCVFTLRALVIRRNRGWWDNRGHDARKASKSGHRGDKHRRHFRVRRFGCLGFLQVDGGPTVTPTAQVVRVECGRIPRGDMEVVAPTDAPADNS
jgi:hypothetical protein